MIVRIKAARIETIDEDGNQKTLLAPSEPIDYARIVPGTGILMDGDEYIVEYA
jgi:hypothetical protein